jgi:hypothetical protein
MKYIKNFESRTGFSKTDFSVLMKDYANKHGLEYVDIREKEVWELDHENKRLSGFSIILSENEIDELVNMGLLFNDFRGTREHKVIVFYDYNRDKVENFIELKRDVNKYNL